MTLSSPPDFNPDTYAGLAAMVDAAPLLVASIGPDQRYRLEGATITTCDWDEAKGERPVWRVRARRPHDLA